MPTSKYDPKLDAYVIALKRKYTANADDTKQKGRPTRGK